MNRAFVITGGPGGGKTTLLDALAQQGFRVAPEAARRIIRTRLAQVLPPRPEPAAFAREILSSDMEQYRAAQAHDGVSFFDRGVPDALYMLDQACAITREEVAALVRRFPYNNTVFLLPPWEDIYGTDAERDQSFEEAVEVFQGMSRWYRQWGYRTVEVPRVSVANRIAFIQKIIGSDFTQAGFTGVDL